MKKQLTLSAKNKAFWKKSKAQQCVAVAKDVLKQIEIGFFTPTTGDYFTVKDIGYNINVPAKLDEAFSVLKDKGARCEVCGIGSCFASLVNLGNNATTTKGFGSKVIDSWSGIGDDYMRPILRKVFSPSQLSLIEQSFEKSWALGDTEDDVNNDMADKAVSFGIRYKTDSARLKAIMNNIIQNKGTFIP